MARTRWDSLDQVAAGRASSTLRLAPAGWVRRGDRASVTGMANEPTRHLLAALRRPAYLGSAWPWRALAYLATSVPIAGVLSVGLLVIAAPLVAFINATRQGRPVQAALVVFCVLGAVIIVALAPVVSIAGAAVERWRLPMVDPRPVVGPRLSGLAARFTTAWAWLWGAGAVL